jgi:hypothetical protein
MFSFKGSTLGLVTNPFFFNFMSIDFLKIMCTQITFENLGLIGQVKDSGPLYPLLFRLIPFPGFGCYL